MIFSKTNIKECFYCLLCLCMLTVFTYAAAQQNKKPAFPVTLKNPVLDKSFADPTIIRAAGNYYAYATQAKVNDSLWNIQVASSGNLKHWQLEGDALPQKPSWADSTQDFWAPHVLYDSSLKKYVLFYSAESDDTATGKCISVAYSNYPAGPFIDKGTPLICGEGFVNIDPMAFIDPETGKKFLYWGSGFGPIRVQEMSNDWQSFFPGSQAKAVIYPGKEKAYTILIEGAWLDYENGTYFLYYSGDNCCGDKANYAVMVAKADNPLGPFKRLGETNATGSSVILEKDSTWLAPGHNSVFRDEKGKAWIAYHAIKRSEINGSKGEKRAFCILPLLYKNGWPQITKPKN